MKNVAINVSNLKLGAFYLASMKSITETARKAVAIYIHTSVEKGERKEKSSGTFSSGLANRILIPEICIMVTCIYRGN